MDPQPPRGGRRDRSSDEHRLEGDPGPRREPVGARRRRRRGLGHRSRRRQCLADPPRPGSQPAPAPHLARGRRRRGRLRRGGGLGDQRAHRRGLPHRPGHERSSGRQPDGGTARSRCRRGRCLGHVGRANVGRGGSPGFLVQQARLRRSGQPALHRRVRSPAAGPAPSGHPAHDGGDPLRPRAARLQGGAIHRRLPVVRRLDGTGRGQRPLQMRLERGGLCP